MKVGWCLGALLLVYPGCGSAPSAQVECEALLEAYCGMVERCLGAFPSGSVSTRYEQCLERANGSVACEDAATVSSGYERCLKDLAATQCELAPDYVYGVLMPASCLGVIQLE
jgi:hypothetical protein